MLLKWSQDTANQATIELLEVLGQYDVNASSQILTLHQSCAQALRMRQVMISAQRDPILSKQAAMLNQVEYLKKDNVLTNASNGPVMSVALECLQKQCLAWRMSSVSSFHNHLEIIKEMPSFFNILLLQHSPNREYLYACLFDKPRSAGKGKNQASGEFKLFNNLFSLTQLHL